MKYLITAVFALLIVACDESSSMMECPQVISECVPGEVEYTEVPNQGLEEWDNTGIAYLQPLPRNFWTTTNEANEFYNGGVNVVRVEGDEAYQGQGFAAKLITRATLSPFEESFPLAMGALFVGTFTTDLSSPPNSAQIGRPFNRKLASLSGYYKYLPEGEDSCAVYALMRKCRILTDECGQTYSKLDTLGMASFMTGETVDEYTRFILELDYTSTDIPDEVVIIFTSSKDANSGIGSVGSTLYIDELEVTYL